jgi:hypothetical protein
MRVCRQGFAGSHTCGGSPHDREPAKQRVREGFETLSDPPQTRPY